MDHPRKVAVSLSCEGALDLTSMRIQRYRQRPTRQHRQELRKAVNQLLVELGDPIEDGPPVEAVNAAAVTAPPVSTASNKLGVHTHAPIWLGSNAWFEVIGAYDAENREMVGVVMREAAGKRTTRSYALVAARWFT